MLKALRYPFIVAAAVLLVSSISFEASAASCDQTEKMLSELPSGNNIGEQKLNEIIHICPTLALAHAALGNVYMERKNYSKATTSYQEFFRLAERKAPADFDALEIVYRGKLADALSHMSQPSAEQPTKEESTQVVSAKVIMRSLTAPAPEPKVKTRSLGFKFRTRGIGKVKREKTAIPAKIDINILFDTNKANISTYSYKQLEIVAAALRSPVLKDVSILIEGHTDSKGKASYNLDLSERRARSVKEFLIITHGIEASRITTTGKGESEPIASNTTSLGRARNRRVTFINMSGAVAKAQ